MITYYYGQNDNDYCYHGLNDNDYYLSWPQWQWLLSIINRNDCFLIMIEMTIIPIYYGLNDNECYLRYGTYAIITIYHVPNPSDW